MAGAPGSKFHVVPCISAPLKSRNIDTFASGLLLSKGGLFIPTAETYDDKLSLLEND